MSQPPAYPPQPNQAYGYQHPPQPAGPVYAHQMRRQSIKVHLWLVLLTGGIGNIFYVMWAKSKVAARWKA
jgi:hypothetical protein